MDKKNIIKTELFSRTSESKIEIELDLSNYATKSELKMPQALINK